MAFYISLSLQILLAGIIFIFLTKPVFQSKVRFIFWITALLTLFVPVLHAIKTIDTVSGYFSLKSPEQTVYLIINPLSAIFILLLIFCGLFYAVYELQAGFKSELNTKKCIYTTFILVTSLISILLVNGYQYIANYFLIGLLVFLLVKNLSRNAGLKYLKLHTISGILISLPIIHNSILAGSSEYSKILALVSTNPVLSNTSYIYSLTGFLIGLTAMFKMCFELTKKDSIQDSVLNLFLLPVLTIVYLFVIFSNISVAIVPQRPLSIAIAVLMIIMAIIFLALQNYSEDKSKKFLYINLSNILFELFLLSTGLIGVAYNIPAIAIIGIVGFIITIINNILAQYMTSLSFLQTKAENITETKQTDLLKMSGLFMYTALPFNIMFFVTFTIFVSFILSFFTKGHSLFLILPFVLFIIYTILCLINLFKTTKLLINKEYPKFQTAKFYNIFSIIFVSLAIIIQTLIYPIVKLGIIPVSFIINGNYYHNFYSTLMNYTLIYQWFILIFIALLALYLIIRYICVRKFKK